MQCRFNFIRVSKGVKYVYDSESLTLFVSGNSAFVDRMTFTEQQAVRLLMDIVFDTVKPLNEYFTFGRDNAGQCPRCGTG